MAPLPLQNGAPGSNTSIDLSEEARLAQLKRIQELKSKIEAQSRSRQSSHLNPDIQYEYPQPPPSISLSPAISTSLQSHQSFDFDSVSRQSNLASDGHNSTFVARVPEKLWDINTPHDHGQDSMEVDSEQAQSSNGANDQTMDSIFSKTSGSSSHTSADTPEHHIKLEDDDGTQILASIAANTELGNLHTLPELIPSSRITGGSNSTPSGQKRRRISKEQKLKVSDFKPRTTIPSNIPTSEFARQSSEAAMNSRLNPFVLHPGEYQLLRDHICHLHVSAYLNIRNRILRLWIRNPLATVTPEEAAGCATGSKWLGLAEVAYEWLVRRGYINFGCVEVPDFLPGKSKKSKSAANTIVVIGAGMAGLGCARQLEGLFSHYRDKWTINGEEPPNVVVLEGRQRIGGRIYSHPLSGQVSKRIPKGLRCTAELGAHIITGFDRGNPLNMIIRGQLALHYYPLKDNSTLYDIDGKVVNRERDTLVEKLFNDILDRASLYRHKQTAPITVEGDKKLIESGKDPIGDAGKSISVVEAEKEKVINKPENLNDRGLDHVPAGVDKLTGKAHIVTGSRQKAPAAIAAEAMGWTLASVNQSGKDLDLDTYARSCELPTLGAAMDEGVKQYQSLLSLSPQDLRLLNWHFANLEYANATSVDNLSLGGWDQDIGNEFEGEHAQVIGGYIQVPRGILQAPMPLNLKTNHAVTKIDYTVDDSQDQTINSTFGHRHPAKVTCANGQVIEASHVVVTAPLGCLKDHTISFTPELPGWKQDSIHRLGFGTLNKVILVYDKPFWDIEQDMIGLLRDTDTSESYKQADYSANRGRFYLFWNCVKTTGRPLLIGLMAGEAALQAENDLSDGQIVVEVTQQLGRMFRHKHVPAPVESIVTRWGKDKFARGTYSYVSPVGHSDDYDRMAKSVGNLHFAGEATCGTHPATVHGAYISGLRAASDIIDNILGPIEIPKPLVPPTIKLEPKPSKPSTSSSRAPIPDPRANDESYQTGESAQDKQTRLQALETDILKVIVEEIGLRPVRPNKAGANPFLLYSKDKWGDCKAKCDAARRTTTGQATAKASRNEIRAALGQMWREAPEDIKAPYLAQTVANRANNVESAKGFQDQLDAWDASAVRIRTKYVDEHPGCMSEQEEKDMWLALGVVGVPDRRARKESGYAE